MIEIFHDDQECFSPNVLMYSTFREIQQAVIERTHEFARLFQSLDDRLNRCNFCGVETYDDSVTISWIWYGSYGANDEGNISIPAEILFAPKETWKDYIIARVAKEKQKDKEQEDAEKEKERQERIAEAKAILEKEGVF